MHILYFRNEYFYAYNFTGRNENDIVNLDNAEELSMHKCKCRRYYPSEKNETFLCFTLFMVKKSNIRDLFILFFSFLFSLDSLFFLLIYIYNHQIISYHQLFLIVSSNLQIFQ